MRMLLDAGEGGEGNELWRRKQQYGLCSHCCFIYFVNHRGS
jgi:CRISPR-associated protein Cas8b1/Cst1 subtype I-B